MNRRATIAALTVFLALHFGPQVHGAEEPLTVTSWNIEHLGSEGRGFGGGFGGSGSNAIPPGPPELPLRTDAQLADIAKFIQDDLGSDVLALQEIAINKQRLGRSISTELDKIVKGLEGSDGDWAYWLPPVESLPEDRRDPHNEHPAFLWNRKQVRLLNAFEIDVKNQELCGKALFDRKPIVGYFESIREDGKRGNDFVLVNVQMASGQGFDENHFIAMTIIEFELSRQLALNNITESDRIILGDFNDNPSKLKNGKPEFSQVLYLHMQDKGYTDLVTHDLKASRMNAQLDSLIDHILVNKGAKQLITQDKATVFRPDAGADPASVLPPWRLTFSDHFPLSFQMKVSTDDDSDFFK